MKYSKHFTYKLKKEIRFPDLVNGGVTIFKEGEAFTYETSKDNEFGISLFRASDKIVIASSVIKKIEKEYGGKLMLSPNEWRQREICSYGFPQSDPIPHTHSI